MAPALVTAPPSGEGWLHEIKHDGYRTQIIIEGGQARAFSRRGLDWTLFEKRRGLMNDWAAFASSGSVSTPIAD